ILREAVTPPLRVGVVTSAPRVSVIGLEQADAVVSAAGILESAGHRLVEISADEIAAIAAESLQCAVTVLSVSLAGWLDSLEIPDDEVSPLSAAVAADGRLTTPHPPSERVPPRAEATNVSQGQRP